MTGGDGVPPPCLLAAYALQADMGHVAADDIFLRRWRKMLHAFDYHFISCQPEKMPPAPIGQHASSAHFHLLLAAFASSLSAMPADGQGIAQQMPRMPFTRALYEDCAPTLGTVDLYHMTRRPPRLSPRQLEK